MYDTVGLFIVAFLRDEDQALVINHIIWDVPAANIERMNFVLGKNLWYNTIDESED